MSLFKQIKADQMSARKAKDTVKTALLTTILGDLQSELVGGKKAPEYEKDGVTLKVSDEKVLAVVKKFITYAQDTLKSKENEASRIELEVLESYLPKRLTTEELQALVATYALVGKKEGKKGGALVGYVVGQLKEGYLGRFDATEVKGLVEANG